MCPACFATAAWIVAGTVSTSGISALIVSRFRGRRLRDQEQDSTTNKTNPEEGEKHE
jgi:hypothetical protein